MNRPETVTAVTRLQPAEALEPWFPADTYERALHVLAAEIVTQTSRRRIRSALAKRAAGDRVVGDSGRATISWANLLGLVDVLEELHPGWLEATYAQRDRS